MKILLLSAFTLATGTVSAPYSDPPPVPGLLSIVSFADDKRCLGDGVTISTGEWSKTENHCSPIPGTRVWSANVAFLAEDCEITLYSEEQCAGHELVAELDTCTPTRHGEEWKSFSLHGCAALSV